MNLLEAIKKCQPFTANGKESRAAMVNVAYDKGRVIASDGRILACALTPAALAGKDWTGSKVVAAGTDEELTGFPDYERVIPERSAYTSSIQVNKSALLPALVYLVDSWKRSGKAQYEYVDKASPFLVKLDLIPSPEKGKTPLRHLRLTLDCTQVQASFPCEPWEEFETIAFNAEYLLKAVKAIDQDEVILHFQDSTRSALITGKGSEDFSVVLMPVRIREVEVCEET